jgi:hypothetical protein
MDASPTVLSFASEVKGLLETAFVVRIESADEEVTPTEIPLKDFPFIVKIVG